MKSDVTFLLGYREVKEMFKTMRMKMMIPIISVVMIIIAAFAVIIYSATSKSVKENGQALADSIALGLEGSILSREVAEKIMEDEMVAESVMASYILANGATHEDLKAVAERGGIDEIWSTDAKGNTTVTSVAPKVDFNFGSDPNGQAAEYMQLLDGSAVKIVQAAQVRDIDGAFYKFAGVGSWNPKNPQIVQVGRNGQKLLDLEEQIGTTFYVKALKEQLSQSVLFATVVDAQGKVIAGTVDKDIEKIGFTKKFFNASEEHAFAGDFDGTKVMNYIKPLSNGNYLAISISNKILTYIQMATLISAIVAVIIILVIVSITINRQVSRILKVRDSLNDISEGEADLTKRIELDSQDEIGQLVMASNKMMNNFQHIMIELKEGATSIYTSTNDIQQLSATMISTSHQFEKGSMQVEEASKTQLKSTEESALAMEELARVIQHITDSIMQIANASKNTETNASEGVMIVDNLLAELTEVHNKTEQSVHRTKELVILSEKIGEFTNVITGISDQTNLLALNASIEAARAGEAGKGFAVVADEVRKLAEESKLAADRISTVVQDVQKKTVGIVEAIDSTAIVVNQGRDIARKAQKSFHDIAEDIKSVANQVETVSAASEEMASSTEEITATFEDVAMMSKQTVNEVDDMVTSTHEQFETMNEISESVDELFNISEYLRTTTSKYKL